MPEVQRRDSGGGRVSYPNGRRVVCWRCRATLIEGNGATDWQECEWCRTLLDHQRKRRAAIEADPFHGFREGDE